ncbi:MAG: ABC transporter ATP-binding protein [Thermodesulfobacteriota bacterium]
MNGETPRPILEAVNVHRTFQVRAGLFRRRLSLRALAGVDLRIFPAEVVGLVGESGCGKTTLVQMLLGLLTPTSGEILVMGKPMSELSRREISRLVQPVFQDPYSSLNPRHTLGRIISLPLRVNGMTRSADWRPRTLEMMERVGLPRHLFGSLPGQLSGGQRQRVAIARALVMHPSVVICDEPTSALDVSVQAQILNLLLDLKEAFGLTYLLVSHNLAVVQHLAKRVAVMYLGRIVEEAPTDVLFCKPAHPYTRALMSSVLTPDPSLGLPEVPASGAFPNPLEPPGGCAFHPRCPEAREICTKEAPPNVRNGAHAVECHFPELG